MFTNNLSSVMSAGDILIGFGRTVMEAASLGMPTIVPVTHNKGEVIPVLLRKENFEVLQSYNFTNRTWVPSLDF